MLVISMLLTATLTMIALMFVVWLVHFPLKDAGVVDVAWAFGLVAIVWIYGALGDGAELRKGLIVFMVSVWGIRLGSYLFTTRTLGHKQEDGRYQQLRQQWQTNLGLKFLGFFQLQGAINLLLSLPFLLICLNPAIRLHPLEYCAVLVWMIGVAGESLADAQLHAFKANPDNRGRACREGLWNYSRHPNYFFEWLVWVAYALMAMAAPWGWLGLISPVLLLYFLLKVTGIPATEAQALRSKGEDYRDYQRTTSMFIPWFKRR